MKNKYAQSITDVFSQFVKSSKRKLSPLETDDGKEYVEKNFNEFLNNHNIKRDSRNTALGAVFAERFDRTIRNPLKKPVFEKGNDDCLSELPSVIKKYNNTTHSSTKRTPIQASKKVNEKVVYNNIKYKREIQKSRFKLGQLVRTSDIRKVFSKVDGPNNSYNFYTKAEVIQDTIPSPHRINYLPERHEENLILPTKITLDENNQVMKKLNLI